MKIKTDFVTNSSSSSFVVMGVTTTMEKLINANIELIKEKMPYFDDQEIQGIGLYDLDFIFKDTGLSYSSQPYDEYNIMIGMCYTSMGDDETMGEFKRRCREQIEKLLKTGVQVHHIEECWMDG